MKWQIHCQLGFVMGGSWSPILGVLMTGTSYDCKRVKKGILAPITLGKAVHAFYGDHHFGGDV